MTARCRNIFETQFVGFETDCQRQGQRMTFRVFLAKTEHAETEHAETEHAETEHAETEHAETEHAETEHTEHSAENMEAAHTVKAEHMETAEYMATHTVKDTAEYLVELACIQAALRSLDSASFLNLRFTTLANVQFYCNAYNRHFGDNLRPDNLYYKTRFALGFGGEPDTLDTVQALEQFPVLSCTNSPWSIPWEDTVLFSDTYWARLMAWLWPSPAIKIWTGLFFEIMAGNECLAWGGRYKTLNGKPFVECVVVCVKDKKD